MLQKIKKSYLTDLLFFSILFFGLWALYRSRAFLLSKLITKLSHSEFKIERVSSSGLFGLKLYGLHSNFLKIDSMQISASPLELIRFRLQSLSASGIEIFIDSIPKTTNKPQQTEAFREITLPELPFFLASLKIENCRIYHKKDTYGIFSLRIHFKGTTRNFFARIVAEDVDVKYLKLEFFRANVYRIGNSLKLREGELCSNLFCVEDIRAGYDSLITASFSGISIKNANILAENLSISLSPTLDYGKLRISAVELYDRSIKTSQFIFKRTGKTLRYTFDISSDWLTSTGNGSITLSTPISYTVHMTKFSYEEKDAYFSGKLFLSGIESNMEGLLRIDSGWLRDKNVGTMTAFFKLSDLSTLSLDSVFIAHKNSITEVSGILTPDSQFLYILPDIYIEDYDSSMSGHITGEVATTILGNRKILPNIHVNLENINTPYVKLEEARINTHSLSEDSIMIYLLFTNTQPYKGPSIDTLTLDGTLTDLSEMSYVMSVKSEDRWLYLAGSAFRGPKEYTFNIDTVYGIANNMHLYSERALFLSYKKGIFYLTTGNLYLENGRLRIQGTFEKSGTINLLLLSDSLRVPYRENADLTVSTVTQITGNLQNPVFVSRGQIHNPVLSGIPFESILYSMSFVNQTLSIDYLKAIRNGGTLTAYGTALFPGQLYPIKYDSIMPDIILKFDNFDITPLSSFIAKVYSLEYAEVSGNVNVKGTLKFPFLSGGLSIRGQNGYLPSVGIRTDNIKGYIQFAGRDIILKSLRAESDAGEIIAFGKISSSKKLFDSPDITISAREVYLEIGSNVQALCNAHLSLTRGQTTPLLIKGNVNVKECYIYAEFSAPRSASKEKSNPVLALDLNISWDENVYLINEIAEIEFSGKLSYLYNRSGMLMNGRLSVLGGNFSYFDRLFKVDGGSVEFNNLSKIDPDLNINAVTDVDSYTIRLNISGTLSEPVVNLSSEPPLDESNIFALLTFGKLLSETEAGIINAGLLEKKALGFAQSYLLRNIKRRLGLRELEISSGSLEEDPHLTIGFYVTKDIYLKYYHDFLSVQYDRFDLRYRISRYFGLNATKDEEGQYYFGIFFEKRF